MNKKLGNDFESEFCCILAANGFWAHNFAQNRAGQPADVIAAKKRITYLIDCKVCSDGAFRLSRIEENQRRSMNLWTETGNGSGWFALKLPDGAIYMMFMELLLRLESAGRSEVSEEEIRRIGVRLEEWLETFVCW